MKKKQWIIVLVVVAVVLAAAFPGRFALREYRFQKALANLAFTTGRNTGHIDVCLNSMCHIIDEALETEDVYEQRAEFRSLAFWAQDCWNSLGELDYFFNAYIQTKDRSYVGKFFTGDYEVRDGCLKLGVWLLPYITGEAEPDETFWETLLAVKEDLLWFRDLWNTAFVEEKSEKEFIAAYHELFYTHEPEFGRFFIEVHQALESQNN